MNLSSCIPNPNGTLRDVKKWMEITAENLNAFSDFQHHSSDPTRTAIPDWALEARPDWPRYETLSSGLSSSALIHIPGIGIDGSLFKRACIEIKEAHTAIDSNQPPNFSNLIPIGMQAMFLAQRLRDVLSDLLRDWERKKAERASVSNSTPNGATETPTSASIPTSIQSTDEMTIKDLFTAMKLAKFPHRPISVNALRTRLSKAKLKPIKQGRQGKGKASVYSYKAVTEYLSK